eukprot:IDg2277t1
MTPLKGRNRYDQATAKLQWRVGQGFIGGEKATLATTAAASSASELKSCSESDDQDSPSSDSLKFKPVYSVGIAANWPSTLMDTELLHKSWFDCDSEFLNNSPRVLSYRSFLHKLSSNKSEKIAPHCRIPFVFEVKNRLKLTKRNTSYLKWTTIGAIIIEPMANRDISIGSYYGNVSIEALGIDQGHDVPGGRAADFISIRSTSADQISNINSDDNRITNASFHGCAQFAGHTKLESLKRRAMARKKALYCGECADLRSKIGSAEIFD